jgi:hypothetical protein
MNVGSKHSNVWKNRRPVSLWQFVLQDGIELTGSPGIICLVYHQVLHHQLEFETSSMGKYLLAKAHIPKLNNVTESEVTKLTSSTVNETALAMLKRQGSRGLPMVSSQTQFTFDFRLYLY